MKIFISSVQREFEQERQALGEYLAGDPLLRRFFECFIFERDVPATDRRPNEVYLSELAGNDIYIGLFGDQYGWENPAGLSPTHLEFNEATRLNITRYIFIKGEKDDGKHPKMQTLIHEVEGQLVRRRFKSSAQLHAAVYASLVDHLEFTGAITQAPWDARGARNSSISDIDPERIQTFVRRARRARNFPLPEEADVGEVLTHLNLLDGGKPTHAAILLFGRQPQRFTQPSEVKCAHFHGIQVAKPIPSYQTYKGTAFELVDQSIDFVMSKINVSVGTRAEGPQAPVEYEIPREVVAEAIVNAIAHRDYSSNGSVQVMLFADRLEVWNPGTLPPSLTTQQLREHHGSFPRNPLLAEPLYLTKYIERMGTGTQDMIRRCVAAGLPEPEFKLTDGFVSMIRRPQAHDEAHVGTKSGLSRDQVGTKLAPSRHQVEILRKCLTASSIPELMLIAQRKDRTKFRHQVLQPLLDAGWLTMTIPDKPTSSKQRYQTTDKGRLLLDSGRGTP